ncbi:tetratricopeptide repeat protein [Flavobacteriaceae bacterium M23B6Z8]
MKTSAFSFLFFCFVLLWGNIEFVCAQQTTQTDSLKFYYELMMGSSDLKSFQAGKDYFERELAKSKSQKDTSKIVLLLEYEGFIEMNMKYDEEAEADLVLAIEYLENRQDSAGIEARKRIWNQLGIIYRRNDASDKALELYMRSLSLSQTPSDSITTLNNIGNTLRDLKRYDQAILNYQHAINLARRVDDKKKLATNLDNLGYTKSLSGRSGAVLDMEKALQLRKEIQDTRQYFTSYRHLSLHYKRNNQFDLAKKYAKEALENVRRYNNQSVYEADALKLLVSLDDDVLVSRYVFLKDSLEQAKKMEENQYALLKYDVEKEREATEREMQRLEIERTKRLWYQRLVALLVFISILIYYILVLRHKKDKLVEIINTENRISKKVHDEVANDVFRVMTQLQANRNSDENLLDDLEAIYTKTRDISNENSLVEVTHNFEQLLTDLLLSYKSEGVSVLTTGISKIKWDSISDLKKNTIYRILQELMTNMKKHSSATHVIVAFSSNSRKIIIDYKDNGTGAELKKGNGLRNTENRMAILGGSITFESRTNEGFKAKMIM